jgi:hypothetical protein
VDISRLKADLDKLISLGDEMAADLAYQALYGTGSVTEKQQKVGVAVAGKFEKHFQGWYSEAYAVVKQLLPDRLTEFKELYQGDGKRKRIESDTYHIQDWLNGIRAGVGALGKHYNDAAITAMRFNTQLEILKSAQSRFESSLYNLADIVRVDLFDSELDEARELVKKGFLRGAGAIAGVVIEKHFAQVCTKRNIPLRKQHLTISDFNDLLKNAGVFEIPEWRRNQRLGDLRNLCDHNKQREPTASEVTELIDGADKLCKTIF